MKLEDLKLYERTPDDYYGKDKDGNEYGIFSDGEITPVEKGTIEPNWNHASIKEVKQYIERDKKQHRPNMEFSDLIWWERSPESFYGEDEDGNVYGISYKTGEIEPRPDVTIDIMWPGANMSEVEQALAKAKEYAEKEYGVKPREVA